MNLLRRALILSHRYLGIPLSLLAIMWFATGITMMYVGGMPRMSPQLRLDRLQPLDLARVRLTPADAAARADIEGPAQLLMVLERPAYRIGGTTVFADTGDILEEVTADQARQIGGRFMNLPASRIAHVGLIETADQWTLEQSRNLPLHRLRVDDPERTELYVQSYSGEITALTTRTSRGFAWVSTIPHFLYFAALRNNQPVWYRVVVWTSGGVCLVALIGLVLGFTQFRTTRPFNLSKAIPYTGFMRWHYITGVVFGVFSVTWAFSGMLSMEPFAWTNVEGLRVSRNVFTGGQADLGQFAKMDATTWDRVLSGRSIKEVEFARIEDQHYYVVRQGAVDDTDEKRRERLHQPYYIVGRAEQDRVLVNATTLDVRQEPFSTDSLLARLKASQPGVAVVESTLLTDYDSYYYSRGRQTPLPVLRVKFNDPAQTWVYVDPAMGRVLSTIPKMSRVERWAYNGLHSLDFSFWYGRRPLWDIGMITLLAGGLLSSCFGFVMAVRRVRRAAKKAVGDLAPIPDPAIAKRTS